MGNTQEFLKSALAFVRKEQLFSEGRLLSPAQVAQERYRGEMKELITEGWAMTGELHPALFAAIKSGAKAQVLIQVEPGAYGVDYFLYAHKYGSSQHRLLMPLFGKSVKEFLAQARFTGIGTVLTTKGVTEALVARLAPREAWAPLVSRAVPEQLDAQKTALVADELTRVALELLRPEALGDGAVGVEKASVTLVFSEELAQLVKLPG